MEDFYYSYPAPKQDSGSNNLTFEAPLEQYTNQNSGKEQVRLLYNSSQLQLRGGDGEQLAIEGEESGKQLFSKGVGYSAEWEDPGVYNGTVKTTFLSSATQPREITFPDKSGSVYLSPILLPATNNNLLNSNGSTLQSLENKFNILLDFLREISILAYPNVISSPIAVPGIVYWDTLNINMDFDIENQNILTWRSKNPGNNIPLEINKTHGSITLEPNIFSSTPGIRFGEDSGASIEFAMLELPYTIFGICKADSTTTPTVRRGINSKENNAFFGIFGNSYALYNNGPINFSGNGGEATSFLIRSGGGTTDYYLNGIFKANLSSNFNIGPIGLGVNGLYAEPFLGWYKCLGVLHRKITDSELVSLHEFLVSNI